MAIKLATYKSIQAFSAVAVGITTQSKDHGRQLPPDWQALIARVRAGGDLTGKKDEISVLYLPGDKVRRLVVVGLGEPASVSANRVREAVGRAVKRAQVLRLRELALALDSFVPETLTLSAAAQAAAQAAVLAQYQFRELKTPDPQEAPAGPLRLCFITQEPEPLSKRIDQAEAVAEAANWTRTLADRPGNRMFPEALAQEAKALARRFPKISVTTIGQAQLAKAGFGALTAVGQGSAHPPVLIVLNYRGGRVKDAPIALVGKGITFDSGGINLKPSAKMEDMKYDMAGAAAVLGIFQATAGLRLPVNLVGVVPVAENLPSGSASRPGDVVKSLSGKTIEILNTDAEGRLILADALTYAQRYRPSCLVDLATLTGAVVVALGTAATGLIGNRESLVEELRAAGERSGERVWPLPLWDEYRDLLKSDVADVANMGNKPGAGTIIGAAFLEKFVGGLPWAHLDIAGTAYGDGGPVYAKGATGVGVRLIVEWLLEKSRR